LFLHAFISVAENLLAGDIKKKFWLKVPYSPSHGLTGLRSRHIVPLKAFLSATENILAGDKNMLAKSTLHAFAWSNRVKKTLISVPENILVPYFSL
jgi:hypothetical protein